MLQDLAGGVGPAGHVGEARGCVVQGLNAAYEILRQAVEGVSDIITTPGEINTDFNDIKSIMEGAGPALMGIGIADGDRRAQDAAAMAVNSPLLDVSIAGAKGVLFVIAGSDDLGILEVQEAAKVIGDSVDKSARIIFGIMRDEKLKKGQIRIIVIATGFPEGESSESSGSHVERSLFAMPAKEQEETRGKIFSDVLRKQHVEEAQAPVVDEVQAPVMRKEEPLVTAQPHRREESVRSVTPPSSRTNLEVADEEDETWGAIPSFLRRHKK